MEKEIRQFDVPYDLHWEYYVEISQIRKDLEELEKLGATNIEIDAHTYYDCTSVSMRAVCERLETDEEFALRCKEVEEQKEIERQRELEYYNMIRKKYNL